MRAKLIEIGCKGRDGGARRDHRGDQQCHRAMFDQRRRGEMPSRQQRRQRCAMRGMQTGPKVAGKIRIAHADLAPVGKMPVLVWEEQGQQALRSLQQTEERLLSKLQTRPLGPKGRAAVGPQYGAGRIGST